MECGRGRATVLFGVLAVLAAVAGLALFGSPAVADAAYQISVPGSIDIPARTVEIEGTNLTVSSYARFRYGETVPARVDAPSADARYDLYLYNSEERIVMNEAMTGDERTSFDMSGFEAGTYLLIVNGPDGEYRAAHPVVLASHEASLSVPETVATGESVTIRVEISRVEGSQQSVRSVEVVLIHDGTERTLEATRTGSGTYAVEATIEERGSYRVYAAVRGRETFAGRDERELIGISDEQTIEVTANGTAGGSGGGGQGGSSTGTPTATPRTPTPTAERSPGTGATPTATPPTGSSTAGGTGTTTADVVLPSNATPTGGEPSRTTTTTPLRGPTLVGLLLALLAVRRLGR